MALVIYYPGDGTVVQLDVAYISNFPRDTRGFCAFCHGDPCAEDEETSPIARYLDRNAHADTCPMCDGRPT